MKKMEVNLEMIEKIEAPSHFMCFITGVGLVATVIALT